MTLPVTPLPVTHTVILQDLQEVKMRQCGMCCILNGNWTAVISVKCSAKHSPTHIQYTDGGESGCKGLPCSSGGVVCS